MPRVDFNSTLLNAAAYRDQRALLELEFKSGRLSLLRRTSKTYQELLQAESKGAYFDHHIRNRFPYAQIRTTPVATAIPRPLG